MVSSAQRWWLSCGRLEKTPQGASSYEITMKDPEIEDKLLPRRKVTTKKRGADA
jgi:hypothetical protein